MLPSAPSPLRNRRAGVLLVAAGAAFIAAATLSPSTQNVATEILCVICGELGMVDTILNVLLFVPLGAGLAIAGLRVSLAIAVVVSGTIAVEVLQIVAVAGRDASLGDVLWNSLGGLAGFLLGARPEGWLRPNPRRSSRLVAGWVVLWIVVHAVTAYALRPAPTESRYFGQLGRDLADNPRYPGEILSGSINGVAVPDTEFLDARPVRGGIASGRVSISALLIPAPVAWHASLVRIADNEAREIAELAALHDDLVFSLRTNAAVLKLRQPVYRLPNALPRDEPARDTARLLASYDFNAVSMSAQGRSTTRGRVPLTTSSAWRLMSPWPVPRSGSLRDALLDAAWLFTLLAPAGYWLAFAGTDSRLWPLIVAALGVAVGYAVGPLAFDLAPPSWLDLAAGLLGAGVGAAIARAVGHRPTHRTVAS